MDRHPVNIDWLGAAFFDGRNQHYKDVFNAVLKDAGWERGTDDIELLRERLAGLRGRDAVTIGHFKHYDAEIYEKLQVLAAHGRAPATGRGAGAMPLYSAVKVTSVARDGIRWPDDFKYAPGMKPTGQLIYAQGKLFSNLQGSSLDSSQTWIRVYEDACKAGGAIATLRCANINITGERCTKEVTSEDIKGGHVVFQGDTSCYLIPLCSRHNYYGRTDSYRCGCLTAVHLYYGK